MELLRTRRYSKKTSYAIGILASDACELPVNCGLISDGCSLCCNVYSFYTRNGYVIIYIGAGFLYFQVEVQIELLKIIITAANAG